MGRTLHPEIGVKLGEDVHERRWRGDAMHDRKAEPMRLPGPVVWVLAEDHHAGVGERREVQRSKHVVGGRVDRVVRPFSGNEVLQWLPVPLGQLIPK